MPKRMTDTERAASRLIAKTLSSSPDKQLRGNASGIAGALVRLGGDGLSAATIDAATAPYGTDPMTARDLLVGCGVLIPMKEDGTEAIYRLAALQPTGGSGRLDTDASPSQSPTKEARPASPSQQPTTKRELAKTGPRKLSEVPHVRRHTPSALELRTQIIGLDPRLWLNGWLLGYPAAMELYGREIRALDAALAHPHGLGAGDLTCRELSYRIFGDEKFLEIGGDGRKLLDRMGVWELFKFKNPVRPELQIYAPARRDRMTVVVSENLDPWVAMRDALYREGRRLILGTRVHAVIFGDGTRVSDGRKLIDAVDSLGAEEVELLYWGDIDRAGVQLMSKVAAQLKGQIEVRPFLPAYRLMLERARMRFEDPALNEAAGQARIPADGLSLITSELPADLAAYATAAVGQDRLIPQEILTQHDL